MLSPSPKSFHKIIVINDRNILGVASIDILSELFRFSFVLLYIAKPEDQKEKNNVTLQNRKTNYSTPKPTSLQSPVHCLTTKYDLSTQPSLGVFFACRLESLWVDSDFQRLVTVEFLPLLRQDTGVHPLWFYLAYYGRSHCEYSQWRQRWRLIWFSPEKRIRFKCVVSLPH